MQRIRNRIKLVAKNNKKTLLNYNVERLHLNKILEIVTSKVQKLNLQIEGKKKIKVKISW